MEKTALVTGASSGIGTATARALARLGYDLVITGRRTDRLQKLNDELEREYGVKVHVLGFDIRDRFQTGGALSALSTMRDWRPVSSTSTRATRTTGNG